MTQTIPTKQEKIYFTFIHHAQTHCTVGTPIHANSFDCLLSSFHGKHAGV